MSADRGMTHPGAHPAEAVAYLIATRLSEGQPTMADLLAATEHINKPAAWWREAAVYLAAQLDTQRRTGDQRRAEDNQFAIRQMARQIDWLRQKGWLE